MSNTKLARLLCITFMATHLPLIAVSGYGLHRGFTDLWPVLGVLFISTLLGASLSLLQVYSAYQVQSGH